MSLKSFKLLRDPKDFFRKGLFSNNQKTDLSGMYQCSSVNFLHSLLIRKESF